MEPELRIYRNARYFSADFPFHIERVVHDAEHFPENRLHQREFWKISCILSGSGVWLLNSDRYPISAGSLILSHPHARTSYQIAPDGLELYNILFLPELVEPGLREFEDDCGFFSILSQQQPETPLLYIQEGDHTLREIIRKLEKEYIRHSVNYRPLIRLMLLELLVRMARKGVGNIRRDHTRHAVESIDAIIETEFRTGPTLDSFAARTGISKSRLCQLYRAATGQTIMAALRERRLREAKRLLETSGASVIEISNRAGFGDLSSFNRAFLCDAGVTPSEYRRRSRAEI